MYIICKSIILFSYLYNIILYYTPVLSYGIHAMVAASWQFTIPDASIGAPEGRR